MKIFLDTANRELIKKWIPTGLVDGVTTNPSLVSKETNASPKEIFLDICSMIPNGVVSIEVVEKDPEAVYKQAKEIAALAPNVAVKIPFQENYLPVIKRLVDEGVAINVTLIFSLLQALLVAKLGVKYISPFIGRWDDIDINGMELVSEMRDMLDTYCFKSEIIAASIRHIMHWHEAAMLGADIATIPPTLLDKVMSHPLTKAGIEKFDADWKKVGRDNLLK